MFKEQFGFREGTPLRDVWKSATTMSGAQCVMTPGVILMLWLPADSWDIQVAYYTHFKVH